MIDDIAKRLRPAATGPIGCFVHCKGTDDAFVTWMYKLCGYANWMGWTITTSIESYLTAYNESSKEHINFIILYFDSLDAMNLELQREEVRERVEYVYQS